MKYFLIYFFFSFFLACNEDVKTYDLKFFDYKFESEGKLHLSHENEKWKIMNFLGNSIDSGEFKEGVRYGDWFLSKKGNLSLQNWSIVENSSLKVKTNIPYKIDSIKYSDYYIKVLLSQNDYLNNVTFIIDNPDNKNRNIDMENVFAESTKFIKENNWHFEVKRLYEKKMNRPFYLDEYSIKDSLNNLFYFSHFYTKLTSGKLFEITCKGSDNNLETKILSYKIIMNTFVEGERVYNPFIN